MKDSIKVAAVAGVFLVGAPGLTAAAERSEPVGVRVSLVSEVREIQSGVPFWVGIFIEHEPGFHSYWKSPGVVGVPMTLEWSLPEDFTASEIDWPPPQRVKMASLTAYGYRTDTLLPVRITPPETLMPGETARLSVKASWLACADTCHPGSAELSRELPVGRDGAQPAFDPVWRPKLEKLRSDRPRPLPKGWRPTARWVEAGDGIALSLTSPPDASPAAGLYFYSDPLLVDSDKPQSLSMDSSRQSLRLKRFGLVNAGPGTRLRGLLERSDGWIDESGRRFRFAEIDIPITGTPPDVEARPSR